MISNLILAALPFLFSPLSPVSLIYQPGMRPVTVSRAESRVILTKFLGTDYQTECPEDRSGVVPEITSVVSGSFTADNLKEKLYTVQFVDCSGPLMIKSGKTRVYVVRDGKVVFDAPSKDGAAIKALETDDGGGTSDEWVSWTRTCAHGACEESIAIDTIIGNKVYRYPEFESVYISNCAEHMPDRKVEYKIIELIVVDPDQAPVYIPGPRTRKCRPQD
jgi:hypothetical protein